MSVSASISKQLAFERETRRIAIDDITPLKPLRPALKQSQKFSQIAASIKEAGLVELPVVVADTKRKGKYFLLDGQLRIEALKDQGSQEVECIVSKDDEAYTYNKRISRLSAVQEHHMIVRAVERGVSEQRIADALDLDVWSIRRRFRLLDGICDEAAELLADKPCPMAVIRLLKFMKPLRQMQAAELMIGQNNYSSRFVNAILAATPLEELEPSGKPKAMPKVSREQIARLERELEAVQSRTKYLEETYGIDNLCLTVVKSYVAKLLAKPRIARWLEQNQPDYLAEFRVIANLDSI